MSVLNEKEMQAVYVGMFMKICVEKTQIFTNTMLGEKSKELDGES